MFSLDCGSQLYFILRFTQKTYVMSLLIVIRYITTSQLTLFKQFWIVFHFQASFKNFFSDLTRQAIIYLGFCLLFLPFHLFVHMLNSLVHCIFSCIHLMPHVDWGILGVDVHTFQVLSWETLLQGFKTQFLTLFWEYPWKTMLTFFCVSWWYICPCPIPTPFHFQKIPAILVT